MKKVLNVALIALSVAVIALIFMVVFVFVEPESADKQLLVNSLTSQEKSDGWKLLFDGKTLENWHNYGQEEVGPAWKISEGTLMLDVPKRAGNKADGGGDIVTDEVYEGDFEFKADWKVSPYANSGIFFFVTEDSSFAEIYQSGLELQVTDNAIFAEVKEDNMHRAGDLFGLANNPNREIVQPAGSWNQLHVIHQNKTLKVYLNSQLIHDIKLQDPAWTDAVKSGILKNAPISNGEYQGRIGLQDWGSTAWYRNMKIRSL